MSSREIDRAIGGLGRERSDSVGDSVEERVKRKRELLGRDSGEGEKGLADIFKRSKKIMRSPERKEERMEEEGDNLLREIREELGIGLRKLSKEIKEVARDQKEMMREEIERMKEELNRREDSWQKERREIREEVKKLKQELEELRKEKSKAVEGKGKEIVGVTSEVEERIGRMERLWEGREREERKKNVVVKGLKEKGEKMINEIEYILKGIEAEVKVEDVRIVEAGRKEWGGMAVVRLGSAEEKRRVMENKKKLKGGKIWIDEDLSWKERRARYRLRQIAIREEAKGARVWIGKGRLCIEGVWWLWDEEKEELRDNKGRKWEEVGESEEKSERVENKDEESKGKE